MSQVRLLSLNQQLPFFSWTPEGTSLAAATETAELAPSYPRLFTGLRSIKLFRVRRTHVRGARLNPLPGTTALSSRYLAAATTGRRHRRHLSPAPDSTRTHRRRLTESSSSLAMTCTLRLCGCARRGGTRCRRRAVGLRDLEDQAAVTRATQSCSVPGRGSAPGASLRNGGVHCTPRP